MSGKENVFGGFLCRTLIHVRQARGALAWALITISLSLFALTFILLLLHHFSQTVAQIHSDTVAIAFLSVSTEDEAKHLQTRVQNLSPQIQTEILSPADAFKRAQKNWDRSFENTLNEQEIKMPWVLLIRSENNDPALHALILNQLKMFEQIDEVSVPGIELEQTKWTIRLFRAAGWLLVLLLSILVVAVVMNAIRIHVLKQQDEIQLMRLVGATETFIRAPYILEGFLLGFLGSVLAFLLVTAFYFCSQHFFGDIFLNDLRWLGLRNMPMWIFVVVLFFGCALGAFGSLLILLKDYENELRVSA